MGLHLFIHIWAHIYVYHWPNLMIKGWFTSRNDGDGRWLLWWFEMWHVQWATVRVMGYLPTRRGAMTSGGPGGAMYGEHWTKPWFFQVHLVRWFTRGDSIERRRVGVAGQLCSFLAHSLSSASKESDYTCKYAKGKNTILHNFKTLLHLFRTAPLICPSMHRQTFCHGSNSGNLI